MEINDILTDEDLVTNGVWFDYRGGRVKIASWASQKYKRLKDALDKPYERQKRLGINNDEMEKIEIENTCKAMARHIVIDWQDFTSNGEALPYSEQAAYNLLSKSIKFRNDMAVLAADEFSFRLNAREEAEKNSEPPLPTS